MLESINPLDGSVVGVVPQTPVAAIPALVARARAAQRGWAELGAAGRRALLEGAGELMMAGAEDSARLMTREMGKPLREALGEVRSCGASLTEELAEMEAALADEIIDGGRTRSTIVYDPLGVCAAITPWNFPYSMPHWMIVPALMAGNTVVFKPSEETPLTGQVYAEALQAVLPPDVLQVVQGADAQGKALVAADVDLVAFTGSRAVGAAILGAVAPDLKRVILELGGKDPLIVLGDADVPAAARFAARNSFRNAGQVCVSTERIYVVESVAGAFEAALVIEAGAMRTGDGFDPDTRVGPMVNATQKAHVMRQLRAAVADGAEVLFGDPEAGEGNFVPPTVLGGVRQQMDIAHEETFGPVACVIRVPDADAAVAQANDSPYGLGAVVFGEAEAEAVARRLTAGMVGINRGPGGAFGTPWVGARQSGYGYHRGPAGHRQFAQTRVISRPA